MDGERLSKRTELISLFHKYKPELITQNIPVTTQPETSNLPTLINEFVAYDSGWTGRDNLITSLTQKLQSNCRLTKKIRSFLLFILRYFLLVSFCRIIL